MKIGNFSPMKSPIRTTTTTMNEDKNQQYYQISAEKTKCEYERQQGETYYYNQTNPSIGVFFRQQSSQFGAVEIGKLSRIKIELVNGTDNEVSI